MEMKDKYESDVGRISIRPIQLYNDKKYNSKIQWNVVDKHLRANNKMNYNSLNDLENQSKFKSI